MWWGRAGPGRLPLLLLLLPAGRRLPTLPAWGSLRTLRHLRGIGGKAEGGGAHPVREPGG